MGTWKVNETKVLGEFTKQKPTFDQLLNQYTKAVPNDRPLKRRPRSPPRQGKPGSPWGGPNKRRGDVTALFPPQKVFATMPWASSALDFPCLAGDREGIWIQCYPMSHPPSHQRGRGLYLTG